MFRLSKEGFLDIMPVSMGGTGKQKALALLGDRLLDLKLYESLYLTGEEREGWMTQKRSMLVSNENLSRCGFDLLIPSVMSHKEYQMLSTHEKGTLLEAYVGVLYVQDGYHITELLSNFVNECLEKLHSYLNEQTASSMTQSNSKLLFKSQYKPPADRKKAKSTLLEVLQKRGVDRASTFFTTWSVDQPFLPPFISKFEPNFDLVHCNLPDPGPVLSDVCSSKKEAEENAAAKVLQFFHDRELMVFAPDREKDIPLTSLNPPSLSQQIEMLQEKLLNSASSLSALSPSSNNQPTLNLPVYNTLLIDPVDGVYATVVRGNTEDVIRKSSEEYSHSLSSSSSSSESLISLPDSFPIPDYDVHSPVSSRKRSLDPSQWCLCTDQGSNPTSSTQSVTIFDGPYTKKYRQVERKERQRADADEHEDNKEEGEVELDDNEFEEMIKREREQENRRVKENMIALRKARVETEKKKLENYRKYATRHRGL